MYFLILRRKYFERIIKCKLLFIIMRHEKAKQYFLDNLKLGVDSTSNCPITGEEMDYYLVLVLPDMDIKLYHKTLFKLVDVIGDDNVEKNNNLKSYRKRTKCDICGGLDGCAVLDSKPFGKNKTNLCQRCLYYLGMIYNRTGRNVVKHVDESGFKIISFPEESSINDSLNNNKQVKLKNFVMIKSTKRYGISTHISNIKTLADCLKNPCNYDFIENENRGIYECDICNSKNPDMVSVNVTFVCCDCREQLSTSLEEYIEKNYLKILSKSI